MKIKKISLVTNCYLVYDEKTKDGFLVDCYNATLCMRASEEEGVKIKAILVTHGHYDHITGVAALKEKTGAKIYMHDSDIEKIADSMKNFGWLSGVTVVPFDVDVALKGGEVLDLCGIEVRVIHTPGHSEGSVCYVVGDTIFCGDLLFRNSYGRYDNYDGSFEKLKKSAESLFALEGDYRVLPGHDRETTLDYERKHNPVLEEI